MATSAWSILYLSLAAVALAYGALLTLQAWEFRRFVRSRRAKPDPQPLAGRVAVIVPCRGPERDLPQNLRPLFAQDHQHYFLLFVVESLHDAACPTIRRLMADYPQVPARLLVAGATTTSGQKVHNLIAATADLPDDVGVLAFIDADARPRTDWLTHLVQHLGQPGVAAATSYRWLVASRSSLPNCLAHALDAGVVPLLGPGRHHLVWGGSWAIRRDVFAECGLRSAWQGTLSDDLVAAARLRGSGRVAFEPTAMVATSVDFSLMSLAGFVRRQFTIGRFYAPTFWAAAALFGCLQQLTFWTGVALACCGAGAEGGWPRWAGWFSLAIYALQVFRAALRQDAARDFAPPRTRAQRWASAVDVGCGPLVGLLGIWGLASALGGARIVWRDYHYQMCAGGQVRILRRPSICKPARRAARNNGHRHWRQTRIRRLGNGGLPGRQKGL